MSLFVLCDYNFGDISKPFPSRINTVFIHFTIKFHHFTCNSKRHVFDPKRVIVKEMSRIRYSLDMIIEFVACMFVYVAKIHRVPKYRFVNFYLHMWKFIFQCNKWKITQTQVFHFMYNVFFVFCRKIMSEESKLPTTGKCIYF